VAAQNEVGAIQDQTGTMRDISKDQLRAYLTVQPSTLVIAKSGEDITIPINILNVGDTPAKNVRVSQDAKLALREKAVCQITGRADRHNTLSVSKGETFHTSQDFSWPRVSAPLVADLSSLKTEIVVTGYVDYEDIFGGKWRRKFCFGHTGENWASTGYYLNDGNGLERR